MLNDNAPIQNKEQVLKILHQLTEEFSKHQYTDKICIVGSAAIMLHDIVRIDGVHDIDVIFSSGAKPAWFDTILNDIAKQTGIKHVVNDEMLATTSFSPAIFNSSHVYAKINDTTILLPDINSLAAMKLVAFRPYRRDRSDALRLLMRAQANKQDILAVIDQIYGKGAGNDRYGLEQFLDQYEQSKQNNELSSLLFNIIYDEDVQWRSQQKLQQMFER